ncbi:MAG: CBS domain-containing protein [Bacteroidota bacterium]
MDIHAAVSTIMTSDLITVAPSDELTKVKEIFAERSFHHIPVVDDGEVVGIISKSDYLYFLRGTGKSEVDRFIEATKLRSYKVQEIMKGDLIMLDPNDEIKEALDLFEKKEFRCIPVAEEGILKGLITPYDIIKALNK